MCTTPHPHCFHFFPSSIFYLLGWVVDDDDITVLLLLSFFPITIIVIIFAGIEESESGKIKRSQFKSDDDDVCVHTNVSYIRTLLWLEQRSRSSEKVWKSGSLINLWSWKAWFFSAVMLCGDEKSCVVVTWQW